MEGLLQNTVVIAGVSAFAIFFQTWLSLYVAVRPPVTNLQRWLYGVLFVLVGGLGAASAVMTVRADVMRDDRFGKVVADLVKEGVRDGLEGIVVDLDPLTGFPKLLRSTDCVSKEHAERLAILALLRADWRRERPDDDGVWPEAYINKRLERAGASWRVRLNDDKITLTIEDI